MKEATFVLLTETYKYYIFVVVSICRRKILCINQPHLLFRTPHLLDQKAKVLHICMKLKEDNFQLMFTNDASHTGVTNAVSV